jgi:Na+/melibiose symporter-like transporter
VTFLNTRERIAPPPSQQTNIAQDVKDLAGNGPWLVLFFLALIIMLTITLRNSTAAYYCKYYVGKEDLIGWLVPAFTMAAAAGAGASDPAARSAWVESDAEASFYAGKIAAARYFIKHVLPEAGAAAKAIRSEDLSMLDIPEGGFAR